jgi:DNA replication protein DnaC
MVGLRTEQARHNLAKIPVMFTDEIDIHPEIRAWVDSYAGDPQTTPSIVLSGPTGVGKTHQAYQAIREASRARAANGKATFWLATSHPDLNATQRVGADPDTSPTVALARYINVDLLLLDDVGAGKQTDWTADTLYRLIDHRWSNLRPTIYATNLTPKQITATLGDRVASRIADAIQVIIKGDDRRWGRAR